MKPSPPDARLFEVVHEALQLPRASRRNFLETACANDSKLLRKARLLLPALDQDTTLLQPGPPEQTAKTRVPRQIGPYHLVEVLGEGGMGTVYLAEQQEPIRRHVAVKVTRSRRPSEVDKANNSRLRFELERRTLARMNHPNIAQILEAGDLDDGQPYLVMEHVPGVPIDRYCDENHLDVEARLRLFLQVCAGIHHAHQKGVLHRDIKPLNLLVTDQDEPGGSQRAVVKILDFGIAKELDTSADAQLTVGILVGTPAFASPEMASERDGKDNVDIRSDVYSLGVLLHLLLAGEMPHDVQDQTVLDYFRKLTETDPTPPSSRFEELPMPTQAEIARVRSISAQRLHRRLKGDLDRILLKALAREREERYDSAAALGEDIQRFLAFEPVQARPPGQIYLFRKFLRRNRAAAAAATLILLALVAGLIARDIEAQRARLAQAEAQEVTDFLLELFEDARPPGSEAEEVTLRQVLDRGAERIDKSFAQEPAVRARLLGTMGRVYLFLGDHDLARQLLEKVEQIYSEALPEPPLERVQRLRTLGKAYRSLRQAEAAEELLLSALELHRQQIGPEHPDLAPSLLALGEFYNLANQPGAAIPYLEEILASGDIQKAEYSEAYWTEALCEIGDAYLLQDQAEKAVEVLKQCIRIQEARVGDSHLELVGELSELGNSQLRLGQLRQAEATYRRVLQIREAQLPEDHPDIAYAYVNLGVVYLEMERGQEAESYLLEGLKRVRDSLGSDHPLSGAALVNLATAAELNNQIAKAVEYLEEAIRVYLLPTSTERTLIRQLMSTLIPLQRELGQDDRADYWERRLATLPQATSERDPFGVMVFGGPTEDGPEADTTTHDG